MTYIQFIRSEWRFLTFGLLLTCLSGFGQTFFISIFGAEIRHAFDLTHGSFGTLYAIATCASAFSLIWVGKLIDHVDLRVYSLSICIGMVAACFLFGSAQHAAVLCFAIYLLRLTGQGLMGHTSLTSMARYLADHRGKAVGISALGHQLSEILLPLPAVYLMTQIGWRNSWISFGVVVLCISIPLVIWLLKGHHIRHDTYLKKMDAADAEMENNIDIIKKQRNWTRKEVFNDWRFYTLIPAVMGPAMIVTGVFFHQVFLVETKGWDMAWFATTFAGFAISGFLTALIGGSWVDKLGVLKMLPYYLLPLAIGLISLSFWDHPLSALVFMISGGMTGGGAVVVFGALWPEIYGAKYLGSIRSALTAMMVFASATSPPVMGWLLDINMPFEYITMGLTVYIFLAIALLMCSQKAYNDETEG